MRKMAVSALMMTLLLLPGCGAREARLEEGFDTLRGAVTAAQSICFDAAVSASYEDAVSEYTMHVVYDGQETAVELISPALLQGVKATALRGETSVSYDGVILGAGPLDKEGLTPVSALPVMLDAMASAYVELLWWDGDMAAARLYVGENSVLTLWLEQTGMAPASAEIAADGKTVVTIRIENWQIT